MNCELESALDMCSLKEKARSLTLKPHTQSGRGGLVTGIKWGCGWYQGMLQAALAEFAGSHIPLSGAIRADFLGEGPELA